MNFEIKKQTLKYTIFLYFLNIVTFFKLKKKTENIYHY